MATPFDPFSFDDDDQFTPGSNTIPAGKSTGASHPGSPAVSYATSLGASQIFTTATSRTTNTTKKQPVHDGPSKVVALPPRMNVRLSLHEDVSSSAIKDGNGGVSMSQLFVEGKIVAQVSSSDAKKNAPFCLQLTGPMASAANIKCNDYCILMDKAKERPFFLAKNTEETVKCRVDIPKSKVAGCEIINYSMNEKTQNMPILVQTKATLVNQKVCRISVQIRTNLSNQGNLSNFTVVAAIPTTLKGSGLQITRGSGNWDEIKRIVTWKLGDLPKGQSSLVSVEAEIAPSIASLLSLSSSLSDSVASASNSKIVQENIRFPVLVRCSSELDQISEMSLNVSELESVPASIVLHVTRSFRLLHRVGNDA